MNGPDDHELAEQLRALRPRAVSEQFAGRVAERMEADPLASHRRAQKRFLAGGSAAAAVLLLAAAVVFWPAQSDTSVDQESVANQVPPTGNKSDSESDSETPSSQSTYAVLRSALADSPERLMALLDEQASRPAGTPTQVWRFLDRDRILEKEIP